MRSSLRTPSPRKTAKAPAQSPQPYKQLPIISLHVLAVREQPGACHVLLLTADSLDCWQVCLAVPELPLAVVSGSTEPVQLAGQHSFEQEAVELCAAQHAAASGACRLRGQPAARHSHTASRGRLPAAQGCCAGPDSPAQRPGSFFAPQLAPKALRLQADTLILTAGARGRARAASQRERASWTPCIAPHAGCGCSSHQHSRASAADLSPCRLLPDLGGRDAPSALDIRRRALSSGRCILQAMFTAHLQALPGFKAVARGASQAASALWASHLYTARA